MQCSLCFMHMVTLIPTETRAYDASLLITQCGSSCSRGRRCRRLVHDSPLGIPNATSRVAFSTGTDHDDNNNPQSTFNIISWSSWTRHTSGCFPIVKEDRSPSKLTLSMRVCRKIFRCLSLRIRQYEYATVVYYSF